MQELIDELVGSNVKSITYFTETDKWKITYKNGLNPDTVASDDLIDFLRNA